MCIRDSNGCGKYVEMIVERQRWNVECVELTRLTPNCTSLETAVLKCSMKKCAEMIDWHQLEWMMKRWCWNVQWKNVQNMRKWLSWHQWNECWNCTSIWCFAIGNYCPSCMTIVAVYQVFDSNHWPFELANTLVSDKTDISNCDVGMIEMLGSGVEVSELF